MRLGQLRVIQASQKVILDLRKVFTDISRAFGSSVVNLCLTIATIAQLLRSGLVNCSDERRCICRESQLLIRIKFKLLLIKLNRLL
jgi:hypothetical protein